MLNAFLIFLPIFIGFFLALEAHDYLQRPKYKKIRDDIERRIKNAR